MAADHKRLYWADALQNLLKEHLPFHPGDTDEFRELTRRFAAIEHMFLERESLRAYYGGCMGIPCPGHDDVDMCETAPVASMQIQLMEDVFFALRLYHYANAGDNRGWMNLFRSWARYAPFRAHFRELDQNFSTRFVSFYYAYIEGWAPIDDEPVPHAWDISITVPKTERVTIHGRREDEEIVRRARELSAKEEEQRKAQRAEAEMEAEKSASTVDTPAAAMQGETVEKSPRAAALARATDPPGYCPDGATARSVTRAREVSVARAKELATPTYTIKGIYLDRGRREAGTPQGEPPSGHRDEQTPPDRTHGGTPTPPPGEPV
jgi:hypothetical protein